MKNSAISVRREKIKHMQWFISVRGSLQAPVKYAQHRQRG